MMQQQQKHLPVSTTTTTSSTCPTKAQQIQHTRDTKVHQAPRLGAARRAAPWKYKTMPEEDGKGEKGARRTHLHVLYLPPLDRNWTRPLLRCLGCRRLTSETPADRCHRSDVHRWTPGRAPASPCCRADTGTVSLASPGTCNQTRASLQVPGGKGGVFFLLLFFVFFLRPSGCRLMDTNVLSDPP